MQAHVFFPQGFLMQNKEEENSAYHKKYISILQELNELSKDLWFFDNDPSDFERQQSARIGQHKGTPPDNRYYDDPLKRLNNMKKYPT
jgi:hypothetical protein